MAALSDVECMRRALALAREAERAGEVPVGALVVCDDRVVGEGYNQPIQRADPTWHAEMEALRAAAARLERYRLTDCTLYVTLEPCPMCAAAMVHARLARVVFGAWDPRQGAAGSAFNLLSSSALNHRVDAFGGVLSEDCGELLKTFFRSRREG
jgi:tRNA(adenine34) deaminase